MGDTAPPPSAELSHPYARGCEATQNLSCESPSIARNCPQTAGFWSYAEWSPDFGQRGGISLSVSIPSDIQIAARGCG